MLPYILAIAVALASFILFIGAFALPKLHRQDDFLWSGVGFFYALVLWVCAGRLTGGVLLGQAAATLLLLAFGWQTLKLRRALAYPDSQTDLEGFSLTQWLGSFGRGRRQPAATAATGAQVAEIATEITETKPEAATAASALEIAGETAIESGKASEEITEEITEIIEEATQVTEEVTGAEVEPATPEKRGFLQNLLGSRQKKAEAKPASLTTALDEVETEVELEEFVEESEEDWTGEESIKPSPLPETVESAPLEPPTEAPEVVSLVTPEESEAAVAEVGSEAETEANITEFSPTPVTGEEGEAAIPEVSSQEATPEAWQPEAASETDAIPEKAESTNPESAFGESEAVPPREGE